jgi:hypothetical protein
LPADLGPVLVANVLVDLDWDWLPIEAVVTVLARPGDPELLAGFDVVIVGLEARAFEALKAPARIPSVRKS